MTTLLTAELLSSFITLFSHDWSLNSSLLLRQNQQCLKLLQEGLDLDRVLSWQPREVAGLVTSLTPSQGQDELAKRIEEEEIDGEALLLLTPWDLVSCLGLRLGPALKLHNAIKIVKEACSGQ